MFNLICVNDLIKIGTIYPEVLLALKGIRVRTAARLLGFSKDNKDIFIFKYNSHKMKDNKIIIIDSVSYEAKQKFNSYMKQKFNSYMKQKFNSYIKCCLRDDMNEKLAEVK